MGIQIIKPNSPEQTTLHPISVFLAGSIEMGTAKDWQETVQKEISGLDVTVYNPRRDDWDSTWKQGQFEEPFRSQVLWELAHLNEADIVFMYLDPATKSPISLLELGMHVGVNQTVIVVCPEGFWRKGNVDIVCELHNIPVYASLEEGMYALTEKIINFYHLLYERN
jgi:hypothetical protein